MNPTPTPTPATIHRLGLPVPASAQRSLVREAADRRQADRFPVEQAATVIGRCEGPKSPLVCRPGTLVDISSFGAQLHCSEKIEDSAVWVRYTPADLNERILEAEILWGRAAMRGGEVIWVHGLKFTATLTSELLDGLLIHDLQDATGSTGSIFDDEPATVGHIGDTKLWRDDPESLLRDSTHRSAAYPALVESFCPEPFFTAPAPVAAPAPHGFDRRRSTRHAARRSGTVSVDAPSFAGSRSIHIETEDLSAEGARIVSDSVILTPKVKLRVENVRGGGASEDIECEVRWHAETTAGPFGQHARQTYGLVFKTPLQAATVEALRA